MDITRFIRGLKVGVCWEIVGFRTAKKPVLLSSKAQVKIIFD
jgi:hypothetical protein